jgi:hypothetical protein
MGKTCDKCEKQIINPSDDNYLITKNGSTIELCRACLDKFFEFLDEKEPKNEEGN